MVQPMLATVTLAAGPASSLTGLTLVPQQPRGAACLDGERRKAAVFILPMRLL